MLFDRAVDVTSPNNPAPVKLAFRSTVAAPGIAALTAWGNSTSAAAVTLSGIIPRDDKSIWNLKER